jgi:Spy/CpxP family protein refolding chaperone
MERFMKLNKRFVLTALAVGGVVACGSAFGQDTNTLSSMTTNATSHVAHMFRGPSIDRLSQELGLTDSQKQQVQSVFSSEREQMRNVHQDTTLSTGERRSKMGEIRGDLDTKMQSILTPAQYQKWQSMTHSRHMTRPTMPSVGTNAPAGSAP